MTDDYINFEDGGDIIDNTNNDTIDKNEIIDFNDIIEIEESENFDLIHKLNTNKHRQEGKHSLKRDTIFKGKVSDDDEKEENLINDYNDNSNIFDIHYNDGDDYLDNNNLNRDVYDILVLKTNIDIKQNRRKPNKNTFNQYYLILLKELNFKYTKSEIFVELSYYFTDNIFNMFKLLNKKLATEIIKELVQKGYLKNLKGVNFL